METTKGTHKRSIMEHRSDERLAELIALVVKERYFGESVLDIGCGDGVVGDRLGDAFKYTGLDISDSKIYKKNRENENLHYVTPSEVERIAREIERHDNVLLLDVLEHTRSFTALFKVALERAKKRVIVSLPNELFLLDRLRMLRGKELNAHSLHLLEQPEGFKHQYIINIDKARTVLMGEAKEYGYELVEETVRPLLAKNRVWQPTLWLVRRLCSDQVWSMGSVFIFER